VDHLYYPDMQLSRTNIPHFRTEKDNHCIRMTETTTNHNNAGKINKLVMVFAFNPGILITSGKIYKPTAPVVLFKLSVT